MAQETVASWARTPSWMVQRRMLLLQPTTTSLPLLHPLLCRSSPLGAKQLAVQQAAASPPLPPAESPLALPGPLWGQGLALQALWEPLALQQAQQEGHLSQQAMALVPLQQRQEAVEFQWPGPALWEPTQQAGQEQGQGQELQVQEGAAPPAVACFLLAVL